MTDAASQHLVSLQMRQPAREGETGIWVVDSGVWLGRRRPGETSTTSGQHSYSGRAAMTEQQAPKAARFLRVRVVDHAKEGSPAVNITVPIGVVKWE